MVINSIEPMKSVSLYDLSGLQIITVDAEGANRLTIDTSAYSSRFYIAEVVLSDGNRSVHKIIRNK